MQIFEELEKQKLACYVVKVTIRNIKMKNQGNPKIRKYRDKRHGFRRAGTL